MTRPWRFDTLWYFTGDGWPSVMKHMDRQTGLKYQCRLDEKAASERITGRSLGRW